MDTKDRPILAVRDIHRVIVDGLDGYHDVSEIRDALRLKAAVEELADQTAIEIEHHLAGDWTVDREDCESVPHPTLVAAVDAALLRKKKRERLDACMDELHRPEREAEGK